MRWVIMSLLAAVAMGAMEASAQNLPGGSILLAWDDCYAGGNAGGYDKRFACDTDEGEPFTLVASVIPPEGLTEYIGSYAVFEFISTVSPVPDWWRIGTCRPASALTAVPGSGGTTCPDITDAPQYGGIDFAQSPALGHSMRLRTAYATRLEDAGPIPGGVERTLLRISIDRSRSSGEERCEGCSQRLCIAFLSALLDQVDPNLPKGFITLGEQQIIGWQGGSWSTNGCYPTATEARTWGQLKSLYR